jgi:Kef-type K+ transport system membrane component KefB
LELRMTVVVSLATVFVIATVATVRWAGHHLGHALVAFLAGLFIATTSAGPVIRNAVESIATSLTHLAQHH